MAIEYELKFAADAVTQAAILEALGGGFTQIAMETTYYDTPAGELSARRWTLRRRLENGLSVCTLKTPAGENGRGEWETHHDSIEAAIPELCQLSQQPDLEVMLTKLVPICGARFTRLAKTVDLGDAAVEIALDSGVLLGGGREQPLCEVEVELKSGPKEAADRFAAALAQKFSLKAEKKSKFRRALALAC